MDIESVSDLAGRAAVHAALADPARLAITDALLPGDASPSELAALLAMPSNLLTGAQAQQVAAFVAANSGR